MPTRSKYHNGRDLMIVDDKAPFVLLTKFVKDHKINSEYLNGVLWLYNNVDSLPLLVKEKKELKSILNKLMFLNQEGK